MTDETARITAFPLYQLCNVPEALRALANKIQHGDVQAVRCVVVLEDEDGAVDYKAFGLEPFTRGHAIGLCFCAAKEIAP